MSHSGWHYVLAIHGTSIVELIKKYIMGKDKNEKTVMGKDTHGTFHPGKGKPSGINKQEGLGLHPTEPEKLEEYLEMTDKYTAGEDVLADHVPMRHRNRNTSKGEDSFKGKENKEQSNKSNNQTFTEERSTTVPEELPGILNKASFAEIANFKDGLTVSLYIPTHSAGVEVNEHFDPIAFKSSLNTVEQTLKQKGYDQAKIEGLFKPGYDLIRDDAFWLNLSGGLAVFIAEGFFKYIKMPVVSEPKIVVESTFHVTPLIPLMTKNEYFYLLVISKQSAKFFKGDAYGLQFIDVPGLPQSIEEVKRISELDATTFRTGSAGKRANPNAETGVYHGVGGGNPEPKDNIATYFEAVDDVLWKEILNKENAPLLLAGVEYEIPIYKSCCDYHNVWDKALTGNRAYQDSTSLYKDAREIMEPYFQQRTMKALALYGNRSATEFTSSIISDVIPATYYGRVSHLFVCKNCHVWGNFNEMTNELIVHETQEEGSEDLLDNAVVKTLATGGEVFLLDKEQMPAESQLAALMRY
jgi:hypothetical protein